MESETNAATIPGAGGLPMVVLAAADGARADVYLHGAHVTSWRPVAGAPDRLFLSAASRFAPGTPIRGGVPVCFPQFADQGSLPMHGFARTLAWRLVRAGAIAGGAAQAVLRLTDSADTRAQWPHAFALELAVTVTHDALTLALSVTNTGAAPFAFTGALHTYLGVADIATTSVRGLAGTRYRDKVTKQDDVAETAPTLAIDRPLDRVYRAAPSDLAVVEPTRALAVRATGFADTVVWNPGPAKGAAIADLDRDEHARFLCVEAAAASAPVTVAPGATWHGTQALKTA
ncbi:MAG: D-hexose-6-phosphate mutarotase [Burkholderiales bacterium]